MSEIPSAPHIDVDPTDLGDAFKTHVMVGALATTDHFADSRPRNFWERRLKLRNAEINDYEDRINAIEEKMANSYGEHPAGTVEFSGLGNHNNRGFIAESITKSVRRAQG